VCGIVGYIGTKQAQAVLVSGLEYRGYDSTGIATIDRDKIDCICAKGKLQNLRVKLETNSNSSSIGIGHTRWATHCKPEEYNAHPHTDTARRIAVVQNGIIENYRELPVGTVLNTHAGMEIGVATEPLKPPYYNCIRNNTALSVFMKYTQSLRNKSFRKIFVLHIAGKCYIHNLDFLELNTT
jgi:predicted glutamine amidotransferase